MRSPLKKRFPRELKEELGKYLVLFLFIAGMIAIVSGFLVASGSMIQAYDESFEKYHIEHGNFETLLPLEGATEEITEAFEDAAAELFGSEEGPGSVSVYENFYVEGEVEETENTLRVFRNRELLNLVCLMEGELPESATEIAVDRMHADNNDLSVGDRIMLEGKELTISGLVALPDYSSLFSGPGDMMFDATGFGVAVMTEGGFNSLGENHLHFGYSWRYDRAPKEDTQAGEWSEELLKVLTEHTQLCGFLPAYTNQAIQFVGDDMGKDMAAINAFLYIVIVIIAFIFAITISNTITKEATVIGTLRASGYSRRELLLHYIAMPMLVTLVSAVVGNILGYTRLKQVAADMYYASYSLPTYVTIWNAEAFISTTMIPLVLMFVINVVLLARKLRLSPLKFIRRDLSGKGKRKALRLHSRMSIMKRFRLRVIFQNVPNYLMIVIGIFLANIILIFGMTFRPMFQQYQEDITEHMLAEYQYILKVPVETEVSGAEKYSVTTLKTTDEKLKSEEATVYGIVADSAYLDADLSGEGVAISGAYAEKFGLEEGDRIVLEEAYEEKFYSFMVDRIIEYPAAVAVFMEEKEFAECFNREEGSFDGYFSESELTDIEEHYVAAKLTEEDMTKTSRQMMLSLGSMMDVFLIFGILMFMLIIYLLSKIIIEKNAQSISMTKILGYSNREISGLYVKSTTLVVLLSLVLTMWPSCVLLEWIFRVIFLEYPGYLAVSISRETLVKVLATGVLAYGGIAFLQLRRVKRVPMVLALKNVE